MDCTHGFCGRSESVHSRRALETVRTLSSLTTMHVPRARVQWTTPIVPPARPALVLLWPASRPAHTSHSARDSLHEWTTDTMHTACFALQCMSRTAGIGIPRRLANSPARLWVSRLIAAPKHWHSELPLTTLGSMGVHDAPHNGLSSGALFRNDTSDCGISVNYLFVLCNRHQYHCISPSL
ncbi:hypothetical protein B0H14DRAFT_32317 [Mycena olivaceomarginata]|nr:hypothetical protein B0H14DRAFT_32317 [Mycena olivaceomarginata]